MRVAVVDTSALMRLFVPDGPLPDGLEAALDEAWRAESVLLSPELALAEAGQVLAKKHRMGVVDAGETDAILDAILSLPIRWVGHASLMRRAMAMSRSLGTSVYDALFVALACERRCELFTADDAMAGVMRRAKEP